MIFDFRIFSDKIYFDDIPNARITLFKKLRHLNVNYLGVTTRVGLFATIFFEAKRASKKDFHYNP